MSRSTRSRVALRGDTGAPRTSARAHSSTSTPPPPPPAVAGGGEGLLHETGVRCLPPDPKHSASRTSCSRAATPSVAAARRSYSPALGWDPVLMWLPRVPCSSWSPRLPPLLPAARPRSAPHPYPLPPPEIQSCRLPHLPARSRQLPAGRRVLALGRWLPLHAARRRRSEWLPCC